MDKLKIIFEKKLQQYFKKFHKIFQKYFNKFPIISKNFKKK